MENDQFRTKPRRTKPDDETPLAQVRHAAGLTQPQFAARLGMSVSAIKQVESVGVRCSFKLASKVEFVFGVDRKSLMEGTQAKSCLGRPYTAASYDHWEKMIEVSDDDAAVIAEKAAQMVRDIILAANRQRKIFAALAALEEFAHEYVRESKLLTSLQMVMGKDLIPLDNPTFIALRYVIEKRREASKPKQPIATSAPSRTTPPNTKKPMKKSDGGSAALPTSKVTKKPRGKLRRN